MTDIDIRQADALATLESLETGSVDAVVTDPPYCSGGFSETAKRQAKGQGLRRETINAAGWFAADNMGSAGLVWLLRSVAIQSMRILRDGGTLSVFTDWRMVPLLAPALESSGLRYNAMVVWDKGAIGLGRGFRPQHEIILHLCKGVATYHNKHTPNVLTVPRPVASERHHQTEKPVALMRQIVSLVSPPDGLVVDPFCGSGSTAVACLAEGRRFVGCDFDAANVETALERIRQGGSRIAPAAQQQLV